MPHSGFQNLAPSSFTSAGVLSIMKIPEKGNTRDIAIRLRITTETNKYTLFEADEKTTDTKSRKTANGYKIK